jgi:predicted DNA-binding protein with PD1-like motif
MEYRKYGDTYVVRLDIGDEIVDSLRRLCRETDIKLGHISGFGTANRARIGLLNTADKTYYPQDFEGDMEITALLGTITRMDGDVYLHIHISAGRPDQTVIGGHLDHAFVSATAELMIREIDGEVGRKFNPEAGVNRMEFAQFQ